MAEPTPMPDWLRKQFDAAERTVDGWSDGKREAAGIPRKPGRPKKQEDDLLVREVVYLPPAVSTWFSSMSPNRRRRLICKLHDTMSAAKERAIAAMSEQLKEFKIDQLGQVREKRARIYDALTQAKSLGERLDSLGIKHTTATAVKIGRAHV